MNNELYPKVKQTTIEGLICDMANCVDHVRVRSVQVLAHCPEDEDSIKKIYDLMVEAKKPINELLSKYIVLEEEDFSNGNSK